MIKAIRVYFQGLFTKRRAEYYDDARVVYEQDPETGDYSAYFRDASETVGLGATKEEAYLSLLRTWQYVKALEAQEQREKNLQHA